MKRDTHNKTLVRLMLVQGEITSCQVGYISNANQYFKKFEVLKISVSDWGMLGKSKVKWRFIPTANREKALKYIGITSTDNAQGLC